ncbi:unnamed protein product [Cladocopium goreaui]|uniref:General stress protein 13 n=1 Tax=Cladocopium goreaui TaxID=2562237 RepID=A0A9P1DQ64_9DINO|nr:unnamed protein product [Cladocopium goreaui]
MMLHALPCLQGMAVLERKATFSRSHRKARLWRYCATAAIVLSQVAAVAFVGSVQAPRTPLKVQTCALSGPVGMTVAVLKEKLRERGLSTSGLKSVLIKRLEEAESQEPPRPGSGYSRLTVGQLKAKCAELGLTKSGRKADLVARLEAQAAVSVAEASFELRDEFHVGDKVMALLEEEEEEYEAVVQCNNGDDTYLISWTEDGYEHTQKAENMRLLKRAEKKFQFSAGDKVEGLYHEEDTWYPARVKCINDSGSYTILWEDGEEYEVEEKDLKPQTQPVALADLRPRQKFLGIVARTFSFGTFVNIGAERDGLLRPWFTYKGEEHNFKSGDKVQAFYEDDEDYYQATVYKDNGDGTFLIVWDEDGEEHVAKKNHLKLLRLSELEEGSKVEVFVESVMTDKDGQQKLFLATVAEKIGTKGPTRKVDLSGFEHIKADQWLTGKVIRLLPFGAFVQVAPPSGGKAAQGLLHIREIRDGFIPNLEDELSLGDTIEVRVKYLNSEDGVLHLSMMGG